VQCGRGQGTAQQMRTQCEQRTETFGAVRAEDKNFLPATSLVATVRVMIRVFLTFSDDGKYRMQLSCCVQRCEV